MVHSWSRVAEDLVRSGPAASLLWEGVTLTTHFQPVFGVRRGECAGYEALVRATDAAGRPVGNEKLFTDAARKDRLVILDRACRALHLRNFATVDPGEGKLFLNVHPDAVVADAGFGREFADLIRYYGLVPQRVCLEILEHGCADEGVLLDAVVEYRAFGASIAVDDFGVGRSNIDRVAVLRPDLVKLERSVIAAAVGAVKARELLAAVIGLLRESGARIVVEGIESASEALAAIDSGANFLQGNYFASPAARIGTDDFSARIVRKLSTLRVERMAAAGDD